MCDRQAAEDGVVKAYAAAGLPPPREIVWAGGPFEIANAWARSRDAAGDNVRSLVVDLVCRKAEAAVDRAVGLAVRVSLAGEPRLARVPAFCASIDEAVLRDCERVRPDLRTRLAGLFARAASALLLSFAASSFGLHSAPSLGPLEYFHDVCGLQRQTEALQRAVADRQERRRGSCRMSDVCWLAERPQVVRQRSQRAAACADGPALGYRDGWSAYAWKGVLVPPLDHRAARTHHRPQPSPPPRILRSGAA